jgi:hypothetical protein
MLYKFKSKAAGDVIMLAANGDELLRALGREPAAKGIIEVAHMAAAITAIEAAIATEEADRAQVRAKADAEDDRGGSFAPGLRQRLWPMVEMLQRAQAAGEPVVWGV